MRASGGGKTPALPTTCGDVASGGHFCIFFLRLERVLFIRSFTKSIETEIYMCVFSTDEPRNICSLVLSVEDEKRKRTFCLLQKGSSAPVRTACGSPSTLARALSRAARRPPRHPAARHVSRRVCILGFRANPRRAASRFAARPSRPTLRVAPLGAVAWPPRRVAWATRATDPPAPRPPPPARVFPTSSSSPASPTPSRSSPFPPPSPRGARSSATASGRSSSTTTIASS